MCSVFREKKFNRPTSILTTGSKSTDQLSVSARASRWAINHGVTAAARVARLTPMMWRARRQIAVARDICYVPNSRLKAHRLDVHRPKKAGNWPVIVYVHGGGFGFLSKDSHWHIATALASYGFCVVNINYRLAPEHPYPAALEDAGDALAWVLEHAPAMGGDVSQLILAGESAGANIVTALALVANHRFDAAWAQTLYARAVKICAVLPACGLLDVADASRYRSLSPQIPEFVLRHISAVCARYIQNSSTQAIDMGLASPLALLESKLQLTRPLPSFFITCGQADPILHDSTRLAKALTQRGTACELRLYPGEGHAFQAMPWRLQARLHWQDTVAYLRQHLQN